MKLADRDFVAKKGLVVANNLIVANNSRVGVNTATAAVSLHVSANDAVALPTGNTGTRPAAANGYIRYNTELNRFEGVINNAWSGVGGDTVAGSNTQIQYNNSGTTGASSGLTFTATSNTLFVGNTLMVGSGILPTDNASGTIGTTNKRFAIVASNIDFSGQMTVRGSLLPASNTEGFSLGVSVARFVLYANTGNFSSNVQAQSLGVGIASSGVDGTITVNGGIYPASNTNGTAFGSSTQLWNLLANSATFNANATFNAAALPSANDNPLGSSTKRWAITATTADFVGNVVPSSNSVGALGTATALWNVNANTITTYTRVSPSSNSVGTALGQSTARYVLYANTADVSSTLNVSGIATLGVANATGNVQAFSLGIGTAASGTIGELRCAGDITAFYSDQRLKKDITLIEDPLGKLEQLNGVFYSQNDIASSFGYRNPRRQIGVIAQQVQAVLPEAVTGAPFDTKFVDGQQISISGQNYLTVMMDKLIPLLVESIKALNARIKVLEDGHIK